MAKYNEREGNSCHIHLSFRGLDGSLVMADESDAEHGMSDVGRAVHRRTGSRTCASSRCSTRPTSTRTSGSRRARSRRPSIAWGLDNRTCALRLVGARPVLRLENRVPGGDVNPYLAVAAMIAAGLDGIEKGLELKPEFAGNAYESDGPKAPTSLGEAVGLWSARSGWRRPSARTCQEHYANMGRIELDAFGRAVTDWERFRGFERL